MSAIGDYVHYTAKGYNLYGVARNGGHPQKTIPSVLKDSHDKFARYSLKKTKANNQKIKDYENLLNSFLKEFNPDFTSEEKTIQNVFTKMVQNILNEYNAKNKISLTIDSNLKVHGFDKSLGIGAVKEKNVNGNLQIDLKELINKIEKLETVLSKKLSKGLIKQEEFDKAMEEYKALATSAKKTLLPYKKLIKNSSQDEKSLWVDVKQTGINKVREQLNNMISTYAKWLPIAGIEGQVFELLLAALDPALTNILRKETDKNMDEIAKIARESLKNTSVVGGISISKQEYQKEAFSKSLKMGMGNLYVKTTEQVNKIDVTYKYDNLDFKISAKNITPVSDHSRMEVAVVQGAPLLTLIQNEKADFINHWFNIMSTHYKVPRENAGVALIRNKDQSRQDINKEMKALLFYKGLTGDVFSRENRDLPNLIVVNDKTKGKVRVVRIEDVYNNVAKDLTKLRDFSVKINGKNIMEIRNLFANKWSVSNWSDRVSSLMNEAHKLKVQAAMRYSATDVQNAR